MHPQFQQGEKLEAEKQTESYDSEAMMKLSYAVLIPLVIGGAVYQLLFSSYKRWVTVIICISAKNIPVL